MTQPEEARQKSSKVDDALFAQPPAGSESPGYQNPTEQAAADEQAQRNEADSEEVG